jgi:hypothetical protein
MAKSAEGEIAIVLALVRRPRAFTWLASKQGFENADFRE